MNDAMTKADARKVLTDAPKASVKIGDTLHVYVGADAVVKMDDDIRKGLNRGDMVTHADGSKQWIDTNPVIDLNKSGSAMYTWDKNDTRIKHDRTLITIDADGNRTDKVIGSVYKAF